MFASTLNDYFRTSLTYQRKEGECKWVNGQNVTNMLIFSILFFLILTALNLFLGFGPHLTIMHLWKKVYKNVNEPPMRKQLDVRDKNCS